MNQDLVNKINKMVEVEQNIRFNRPYKITVLLVDFINKLKIKRIISKYGYPNKELLGDDGLQKFWLLIQHMDRDRELQEQCLEKCGFAPIEYAHLYDRVQVNKGLEQKYGTQLNKPIKNLYETNRARVSIGWMTVQDYIKEFNESDDLGRKLDLKVNENGSAEYVR